MIPTPFTLHPSPFSLPIITHGQTREGGLGWRATWSDDEWHHRPPANLALDFSRVGVGCDYPPLHSCCVATSADVSSSSPHGRPTRPLTFPYPRPVTNRSYPAWTGGRPQQQLLLLRTQEDAHVSHDCPLIVIEFQPGWLNEPRCNSRTVALHMRSFVDRRRAIHCNSTRAHPIGASLTKGTYLLHCTYSSFQSQPRYHG